MTDPARHPRTSRAPGRKLTILVAHPSDLLTDHVPNGDGLVAYGFINELASRGHRLHVAVRNVALSHPLPPNVTLHPIEASGPGPLGRLSYMLAVRKLFERVDAREKIDLIHQLNPVFVGLSLAFLGIRTPVVLGTLVARWPAGYAEKVSGSSVLGPLPSLLRSTLSFAQQSQADALLVATAAGLNRVPLHRRSESKIFEMLHGIDAEMFSPSPDWRNETSPPRPQEILFYAHVDHRKGVFVLLDAFRDVLRAVPDCRLTVVGRGDHVAEFEQRVAEYGLEDRVSLLGRVDRAEAPALMRRATLYCLPSFGEPYGSTAVEAMACAKALVITDAGGLTHVVPPDGALRVPTGNAPALAEALVRVLRSPELQVSMGEANRRFVEERCTWERVVDELERVYATVLDRRGHVRSPEVRRTAAESAR